MLSHKLIFSSAAFVSLLATARAQEPKYWVHQSCKETEGFEDALKEVIWSSGEIVNYFSERDVRLEDPLRWLFNIELNDLEHKPQLDMMIETFNRISSLTSTDSQQDSRLRFMCDSGKSFKPKDRDGNEVDEPSNGDAKKGQMYHDEGNDVWEKGSNLPCKIKVDELTNKDLALTLPFIQRRNEDLLIDSSSNQPDDRVVIMLCDALLDKEKNPLWFLPTFREVAAEGGQLEKMIITTTTTQLARNIIHELVHVPFLSQQTAIKWEVDNVRYVSTVGDHGRDRHGALRTSGYYFPDVDGENDFPGPRLDAWQYTVMNPDSYAYLLMSFRFIQKRWEPVEKRYDPETWAIDENGDVNGIGFDYQEDWPLAGDWPGAGPDREWGWRMNDDSSDDD